MSSGEGAPWDPGEQVAEELPGSPVTVFCEKVTGLQDRPGEGNFQEGSIPWEQGGGQPQSLPPPMTGGLG